MSLIISSDFIKRKITEIYNELILLVKGKKTILKLLLPNLLDFVSWSIVYKNLVLPSAGGEKSPRYRQARLCIQNKNKVLNGTRFSWMIFWCWFLFGHIDIAYWVNNTRYDLHLPTVSLHCVIISQKLPRSTESATPGSVPSTATAGSEWCAGTVGKRWLGRNVQNTVG